MPSSRPNTIPTVVHVVRQLQPQSILDVGVGFGKWGHLFREYTDILESERDPDRYRRENWQIRIDGVEGFPQYLTEMHRYLYNDIHVGDARVLIKTLPRYDLIFLGDVLEHMEKTAGAQFIRDALAHAVKAVLISTPKYETGQDDLCGNELERHRSLWSARDFRQFEGAFVKTIDQATLLALILKAGVRRPICAPPRQPKPSDAQRLRACREQIIKLIPLDQPFILVDEEQIRSTLPHQRAIPFLEKDGQYWGPPADDQTARHELERLAAQGARKLVFIWSCFWWLEHYAGFARHLRARFPCGLQNERVIVFNLAD